jgi:hypothetical protein
VSLASEADERGTERWIEKCNPMPQTQLNRVPTSLTSSSFEAFAHCLRSHMFCSCVVRLHGSFLLERREA